MRGLTSRQKQILDFITDSIQSRGYPPTIREIGDHMGIRSTNGVNDHLKALERKGYLRRDDLKSRAMRPTQLAGPARARKAPAPPPPEEFVEIPLCGRVAAGEPILAMEEAEDTVRMDKVMLGPHDQVFALRIVGDSMIEDGIFDGDYVFVRKTPRAERGAIVIALIDDEATCKRYFPEGERVRFQPANAAMQPIYVHKSEFRQTQILGKVVGVYRRL